MKSQKMVSKALRRFAFRQMRGVLAIPICIDGILRNYKGEVLFMFSKYIGIKDSIEAKVLAILEALIGSSKVPCLI